MRATRAAAAPLAISLAMGLGGCVTHRAPPPTVVDLPPSTQPLPARPPVPQAVPDAVPRVEPRSRYGNPPFYDVFGHRYYVLSSSVAYVERGVASWYGPGFNKVRTSTGEPYDMYGMSAAHKTLPLPAYVRVTNLQNGRSIIVRVNDRGPFVGNRLIDLSYSAAAKLDMLRNGTAMVEVRAIDPRAPPQSQNAPLLASASIAPIAPIAPVGATSPPGSPSAAAAPILTTAAPKPLLFVQAGAFADPAHAQTLATKLRSGDYGKISVRDDIIAGRKMYRVRIGPVPNVPEFDRIVAALERAGVHDAHLMMD